MSQNGKGSGRRPQFVTPKEYADSHAATYSCDSSDTAYEPVKEPTQGNYADVQRISKCAHRWVWRPSRLFGYMDVKYRCKRCKTWRR